MSHRAVHPLAKTLPLCPRHGPQYVHSLWQCRISTQELPSGLAPVWQTPRVSSTMGFGWLLRTALPWVGYKSLGVVAGCTVRIARNPMGPRRGRWRGVFNEFLQSYRGCDGYPTASWSGSEATGQDMQEKSKGVCGLTIGFKACVE